MNMAGVSMAIEISFSTALGLTFATSAIPKLRHPNGFTLTVLAYHVLPVRLGWLYAGVVPPLELFVAFLLLSGTAVRSASLVTAALLLSFIIAVAMNVARGRDLDCHCFGKRVRRTIGWGLVLQDSMLLGIAVILFTSTRAWGTSEAWSVFRLSGLVGAESLVPLSVCMGVTMGAVALSRASLFVERRYQNTMVSR